MRHADFYVEKSHLQVYQFLKLIEDKPYYAFRLSRIDITVDYLNENIDPTHIHKDLISKKIGIYDKKFSRTPEEIIYTKRDLEIRGMAINDSVPTVYCGKISEA